MKLLAIVASVKDWADLIHAVAWPLVVFYALWQFRKSIDDAVRDVFNRIPWERTTGFKAGRFAELKISKKEEAIVKETTIPPGKPPGPEGG